MPKKALADILAEWRSLLQAATPHQDKKNLKAHLQKLETAIARFEELEALRAELQAKRQQATQELEAVKEQGKLASIETRSILKAIFGHSNERLVQFQMRPRRSRRRTAVAPVAVAPSSATE